MRNKKLLALFICLVCISVCVFLLTACGGNNTEETTTEPSESVLETTEPEASAPPVEETTQEPGEETTEEATEETTEEPTEPATQPSSKPGGSTQVTTPQTTQPEEETEPEETIAVPAPGTENNAYVENFTSITGQFTTVKIPAGEKIWYKLKTPGHFLQINHQDVWVIYGEKTYKPVDGVLEIPLPADGSKSIAMQFVNKGAEEQQFSVSILDAKGTASNPNVITSVKDLSVSIDKGDTDGIHYVWTADSDGMLRVGVASASSKNTSIDVALTVNGITVKLTDNASNVVEIAVSKGDQVAVAITSVDGKEVTAVISGYVVPMQQLTVAKVPSSEETVSVPAQESVIYQIFGANGTVMRIKHKTVTVICNGTVYTPDENGFIKLELSSDPMQLELCNTGNKAQAYTLSFSYPLGHSQNPEKLTEIKDNTVKAQLSGYWYTYTAEASGQLTISTEKENVEIFMLNNRTQQYANLWYTNENGESVQGENVCVAVEAGDKISLQLLYGSNIELQITGQIIPVGTITLEQLPYSVKSEKVTAGSYVLYNISGAADSVLTIASKDVAVIMDGVTYKPDDSGLVSVSVKADAVSIQLCNNGSKDTVYTLKFDHCLGSEEKPEELSKLDAVKVDLQKGVYYYTYTSKTTGKLSFSTDHADTYIVLTNETTEETASMWYTGEDGQVVKSDSVSVAVNKGDVITVQVVSAEADVTEATVTGKEETIVALTVQQLPHQVESVSIPAGGYVYYDISGVNGNMLTIKAKNVAVVLNGTTYKPDENNILSLKLDEEPVRIQLCNTGKTKTTYMMNFHYPVGHTENAEMLTQLGSLDVIYENGSYNYTYTAQVDGQVSFSANDTDTYIVLTNETTGETNNLWHTDADGQVVKNDSVSVDAKPGDVISIQVFAMADGQTQSTVTGWEDAIIDLAVESLPYSADTEKIAAGAGVIYDISGIAGNMLSIESSSVEVIYNGEVYQPDESGIVTVRLVTEPARVQLCNTGDAETAYTMNFHYPVGHPENPEKLTALGELDVVFEGGSYYYAYTAQLAGRVVFGTADQDTYIVLINETAEETNNLWHTDADGQVVKNDSVSVDAKPGDVISIQVFAMADGQTESTVTGWEDAIIDLTVESLPYSADTEKIAAGAGVIYDISGIAGNMLSIESASVEVIYNGEVYQPDESGIVTVRLVTEPARVQIYNTGNGETAYTMNFHYPVGHPENPENLTALGELDVVFEGGGYYYTYTAQITGRVVFGTADQDTYIVLINETTEETNNLWHTDANGQVVKDDSVSVDAKPGDVISIQVFAMADGQTESTVTGWEDAIIDLTVESLPYSADTEKIAAGAGVIYDISGIAGNMLSIESSSVEVIYNGEVYQPDESGIVTVRLVTEPARVQIYNTGNGETAYTMNFHYPVGHPENPENLTALGELDVVFEGGGYYYTYTAQITGRVVFGTVDQDTYIVLVNQTTEQTASLWYTDDNDQVVKNEIVGIDVTAGDVITIQVFAMAEGMTETAISGCEAYVHALTEDQLPTSFDSETVGAGNSLFYLISGIDGNVLNISGENLSVSYSGESYVPDENGNVELKLSDDKLIEISNTGDEEAVYTLSLDYALGHYNKPAVLDELGQIDVVSEKESYSYIYTALNDGKVIFTTEMEDVDIILTSTTTEASAKLWNKDENDEPVRSDYVGVPVLAGEQVHIQVISKTDAAVQAQVTGFEAVVLELSGEQLPTAVETAAVAAGKSIYYEISGICGNMLDLDATDTVIIMNGTTYEPDEAGHIQIKLGSVSHAAVLVQICNNSEQEISYELNFSFPIGHSMNPEILTELGEITAIVEAGTDGYYYSYTVQKAGQLVMNLWESPEDTLTDMILTNSRTEESVSLWTEVGGEFVFNYSSAMLVLPGDVITVQVTITSLDDASVCIDGQAVLYGSLCGGEDSPIQVQLPGFTAQIPAGETLYYQGYNLSELLLSVSGKATITYNGNTYEPIDGVASCILLTSGRMPAVFAITNTGSELTSYEVEFLYPVGHNQNPETLQLGTNTVNKVLAGMSDHIYTYVVPKDGTLKLTFDPAAQWVYAVDNVDQGVYGESCHSNDDPQINETQLQVSTGDTIQIRVNTFDPENPGTNPAGTVSFTADLYTGPVAITDITAPYQVDLLAGETVMLTANAFGQQMKMLEAQNVTVTCAGETYTADESGLLQLVFPANGGDEEVLEFTVHNGSTADKTVTLLFGEQKGTADNPDTFNVGGINMAVCDAGSEGYHYTFTAEKAGMLRLILSDGYTWKIKFGNSTYTSDKTPKLSMYLQKGKTVELIIYTYDPTSPDEVPAGSVEFTVTFG